MSNRGIPKEKLSAYQRWEMQSFDENRPAPAHQPPAPDVSLPTASEIEQLHQNAYQEGFNAGYQQGISQGTAEIASKVEAAKQLLDNLEQELARLDQAIADDVVSLALAIARQVLQQSLRINPDLLIAIVTEAIDQVPPFNQHAHLVLNPEDALLVKERIGEQLAHSGWKIIEDFRVERGGCRVETGTTQIDATVGTRWKRVVSAISSDDSWLPHSDG